MSVGTLIIILLVLLLVGALPTWPHAQAWGLGLLPQRRAGSGPADRGLAAGTWPVVMDRERQLLLEIKSELGEVLREVRSLSHKPRATKISLELPLITKKGVFMPNFELMNDRVATITIKTTDSSGQTEPVPAGDVFSVSSSNPGSLGAVVGIDAAGAPAVILTPLVQASPGLTITVSDSAGLAVATQVVDIVPDTSPTNIVLDLADATTTTQPVPTAPGP